MFGATIEKILISKHKYKLSDVKKFISRLNLSEYNDTDKLHETEEKSKKNLRKFILYLAKKSLEDVEISMITDIVSEDYYVLEYFKVTRIYSIPFMHYLTKLKIRTLYLKKLIIKLYRIYTGNPGFNDYENFIEYSFIGLADIPKREINDLKEDIIDNENGKSYFEAFMIIISCGLSYAGEFLQPSYAYNGLAIIKKYSKCLSIHAFNEILKYISYKSPHNINKNPKSIFWLISNYSVNEEILKIYKYFYIDSNIIYEILKDIAFEDISQFEEFKNYVYYDNNIKNEIIENEIEIRRKILSKKDEKSKKYQELFEVKNLRTKNIEYILETYELSSDENKINVLEILRLRIYLNNKNNSVAFKGKIRERIVDFNLNYNYTEYLPKNAFEQVYEDYKKVSLYKFIFNRIIECFDNKSIVPELVEIVYLYVKNMHGRDNKEYAVSFSDKYLFRVNKVKDKVLIELSDNIETEDLNKFFYLKNRDNCIQSINALLGKNGTGKTSLLNLIMKSKLFGSDVEFDSNTKYSLISKVGNNLYWITNDEQIEILSKTSNITLVKSEINSSLYNNFLNTSAIFFSNIVDLTKSNIKDKKNLAETYIDISSQYIHDIEMKSKLDFEYNKNVLRLIKFSIMYIKKYKNIINKEKTNFDITVLDCFNIVIIPYNDLRSNIICEAYANASGGNLYRILLTDYEQEKVHEFLNEIVELANESDNSLNFKNETIKNLLLNYYQIKKYAFYKENSNQNKEFSISSNYSVWNYIKLLGDYIENDDKNLVKINIENDWYTLRDFFYEINNLCRENLNFIIYQIPNMSSGEMARLNLFSRLDWIWNNNRELAIDDVKIEEIVAEALVNENNILRPKRNYVLILDEVEVFFHPEWQRKFIYDLILFLEFEKEDKNAFDNIQIIVSSNSPFFISDMPQSKIQFLKEDGSEESKNNNVQVGSFGQNIYAIMKDAFFMEGGLMGEFAKFKLNKVIRFFDEKNAEDIDISKEEIKQIINLVEEPLIKKKLINMYNLKYEKIDDKYTRVINLAEKIRVLELNNYDNHNYERIQNLKNELMQLTHNEEE